MFFLLMVCQIMVLKSSDDHAIELPKLCSMIEQNHAVELSEILKTVKKLQDFLATFNLLKVRMRISDDVRILFSPDQTEKSEVIMCYDLNTRTVYISAKALDLSPSVALFTLIHELTHAQQHQQDGLEAMLQASKQQRKMYEHQADRQACLAIKCPICLQIRIDHAQDKDDAVLQELGQFSRNDIDTFKHAKSFSDVCLAHSCQSIENKQLCALLPGSAKSISCIDWLRANMRTKIAILMGIDLKAFERRSLDCQIGCMMDRLSTVIFE